MNLIETNLIQVLPENPFIMLRSRRDSAERSAEGGWGEEEPEREAKGNCINEGIHFVVVEYSLLGHYSASLLLSNKERDFVKKKESLWY